MARAIATIEELRALNAKPVYTIIGAGGDLLEWTKGYEEFLNEADVIQTGGEIDWLTWTGELMNEAFKLTRRNSFQPDVTFLAFAADDQQFRIGKLAMFKLRMQDRWLEDIVANAQR